jgi:hypothetical protein
MLLFGSSPVIPSWWLLCLQWTGAKSALTAGLLVMPTFPYKAGNGAYAAGRCLYLHLLHLVLSLGVVCPSEVHGELVGTFRVGP